MLSTGRFNLPITRSRVEHHAAPYSNQQRYVIRKSWNDCVVLTLHFKVNRMNINVPLPISIVIPFPIHELLNRGLEDWKREIKRRVEQEIVDIVLPTNENGQWSPEDVILKKYPIRVLYCLSPGFRPFSRWLSDNHTNILELPHGWCDRDVLFKIALWLLRFARRPRDDPAGFVLNVPNTTEAIKVYITVRALMWREATKQVETVTG